ncbi:MAG: HEAT repeat domain-containing protein [Phototrophicaceae bacterium]|jgi:HEAT repeat protein
MRDEFKQFSDGEDEINPIFIYTLDDALTALTDSPSHLSAAVSYGLSDVHPNDLARFQPIWDGLSVEDHQKLLAHLVDVAEANFELDYRTLARYTLKSSDPASRVMSLELLWEDESLTLLDELLHLAEADPEVEVRAAAANQLGRFILLSELGRFNPEEAERAHELAIRLWNNPNEDFTVRRRALEALSNSSHDMLPDAIQSAYRAPEVGLKASALYAMGRSCDLDWAETVIKEMKNPNPQIRYEAVRASGELELNDAVKLLAAEALSKDREIQEAAIWSLGQIGTKPASRALDALLKKFKADDSLLELIEEALDLASFGDLAGLPGLNLTGQGLDD